MRRITVILKSFRFWLAVIVLPLVLLGCASSMLDFESDFVSDAFVTRETVTTQINDETIELSYLRAGDPKGQRVIFVHGTPGDAGGNWYNILKNVPQGIEFIAIDRPGFGFTKPKTEMVRLDDQAAALAALFETKNGQKVILAGHSLGGPIVAAAAANYPDQVSGILVLAGALDPDLEEVLFIQHVGNIPPFIWLIPKVAKHSNRELIALEDELRALKLKLPLIEQPVTIIHGTADDLVPYENVAYMQRTMIGTQRLDVVKIDGMNHFLQWQQQELVINAVLDMSATLANNLIANASTLTAK